MALQQGKANHLQRKRTLLWTVLEGNKELRQIHQHDGRFQYISLTVDKSYGLKKKKHGMRELNSKVNNLDLMDMYWMVHTIKMYIS